MISAISIQMKHILNVLNIIMIQFIFKQFNKYIST